MIILRDSVSTYTFDSLADSLRRLSKWNEQNLINERDSAKFIIQLFHQIPDDLYNSIQGDN